MSSTMAWVKANVAIVALLAVIIVTLPAAYIGSSMWNKSIRNARQAEATKAMTDLNALRITYMVPSPIPGVEPVTLPLPAPHPRATEYFREHRQKLEEQVGRVVEAAKDVNSQGHTVLVRGVFPTPESRVKTLEFAEAIVGKDDRPGVYRALLASINAGQPPNPMDLQLALQEHRTRYMDGIEAAHNRTELTREEGEQLAKELAALRLGYYQQQAQRISVYATAEALPREVPTSVTEPPSVELCFNWQFDYWVISDLIRAIDSANTIEGERVSVDGAVVKRIEQISLDPLIRRQATQDPYGGEAAQPRPNPITGRRGGTDSLYDVRNAKLTVLVGSSSLPQLIDAISRTNFMTVIGLELEDVDPWADLEQGYYYGPDHLVRAKLDVETVWLRNWTTPLMPPQIRMQLTGSEGTESEGETGGAG